MKILLQTVAVGMALGLAACADSASTATARNTTGHADSRLGSHVPRSYNAAPSQDEGNPALAGERAFPTSAAGSAGTGPR